MGEGRGFMGRELLREGGNDLYREKCQCRKLDPSLLYVYLYLRDWSLQTSREIVGRALVTCHGLIALLVVIKAQASK
jgi:hypothetical protein